MFWSSAATSSNIDQVLDDPSVTLKKILEQEDVLQELRALNKKLMEHLTRPDCLNGMLDLITTEPIESDEVPMRALYKLPTVACEVLTCDNNFSEKIAADKAMLDKLFFFFRDKPNPINPLLASYVCRLLTEMISRKLDQNWYSYQLNVIQVMGYLQGEEGVLSWLLNHMDCSAVCEFFYKLMLNVEGPEMRTALYDWMVEKERIFLRFMEKMTRYELNEVHANMSRLIGDLLFAFQDEMMTSTPDRTDCDPFLLALRSHETITALLGTLFTLDNICETSIVHGLDLILSLIGVTRRSPRQSGRNDSLEEGNEGLVLSDVIKEDLLAHMPTLLTLLQSPTHPEPLKMTYGLLEKPVGLGRLAIAKFIAHLFTLNDDELNMGIIDSGMLKQLLDLFWCNPWNNFLHRYVCKILTCIARSAQFSPGSASYLVSIGLLEKIIQVFESKELKCGYKGHLAKVASAWGEAAIMDTEGPNVIRNLMHNLEETDKDLYTRWDVFYSDTLENYLSNERVLLAGVHPPAGGGLLSSMTGQAMPYNETDSSFSTGAGTMQWLGFSAASQSMMNIDFDSANSILNLTIGGGDCDSDSPASKAKSLFEMFCNEKSNSFDDDDDEDEDGDEEGKKKNSFDLSSPDSDSLDEDKWVDAEKKINADLSLPFNAEGGNGNTEDDDIFSTDNIAKRSPPMPIPILGPDPWSNLESSSDPIAAEDPWSNPEALFSAVGDSGASEDDQTLKQSTMGDWANFDQNNEHPVIPSSGNGEEEWASFESAVLSLSPIAKPNEDSVVSNLSKLNVQDDDSGKNSSGTEDVVLEDVNLTDANNVQQFQSPAAKDETVSTASQQVSATI